jgi:hypothetical protein
MSLTALVIYVIKIINSGHDVVSHCGFHLHLSGG